MNVPTRPRLRTRHAGNGARNRKSAPRLDAFTLELVDNLGGVLERSGRSALAAARRLMANATDYARTRRAPPMETGRPAKQDFDLLQQDTFAHILSWWWTDPQYCKDGVPRAIPEKGPAPSIAALARRLGKQYTVQGAMKFLLRTQSIAQLTDGLYVPLSRWVTHRDPDLRYLHHLRTLGGFLRTLSHNAKVSAGQRYLFEFSADARVPLSKVQAVHEEIRKAAQPFLVAQDTVLERYGRTRKPGERTVPVMLGMWASEGKLPRLGRRRSRKRTRRTR